MINFVSTFPPIMCGIGTYMRYLVSAAGMNWKVVSYNLDTCGSRTAESERGAQERVSYVIPNSFDRFDSMVLEEIKNANGVVWIQHSFGLWKNDENFVQSIKGLKKEDKIVIVSLHTVHFQSRDTKFGLAWHEYKFLKEILPVADAITLFSLGAYNSVVKAFPNYRQKISLIRHGTHLHPDITLRESRRRFFDYLVNAPDIPTKEKMWLKRRRQEFFDERTVIIGDFGFIGPWKGQNKLYSFRKSLQERLPEHKVIALCVGALRQQVEDERLVSRELASIHDSQNNFYFEAYLPEDIFPLAFKAMDANILWPEEATQSGRLAHAMGVGAYTVGKDLEGIGETLRLSGCPVANDGNDLLNVVERLVRCPDLRIKLEKSVRKYAEKYSWRNQALKHYRLAEAILSSKQLPLLDRQDRSFNGYTCPLR
jgi:glycosyltransferase involved in cell wall biosynthesis